jgi:AcrR family transcriptional regulator
MPDPRGRVRDPERRGRILTAAAELIARRGYQGVNTADIGDAAGIVGSGIYRHFENKVAILVALFDLVVDRLVSDAEAALRSTDDPLATLAELVRVHVHFTMQERRLCQVYVQESRNLPAGDSRRLRWKQRHYLDLWQDVLASVHPDTDPTVLHATVHAAIAGIHSVLHYRSPLPDDELAELTTTLAWRTLGLESVGLPEAATPAPARSAG